MMKSNNGKLAGILAVLMIVGMECGAATHYVVPPGTAGAAPADPYTNWVTAGTNIIDVVNAAMTNIATRVIWVTNGTYYPTNVINITQTLTLQSVNGRDLTILNGTQNIGKRCIYCSPSSAANFTFDGFTVINFYTDQAAINSGLGVVCGYASDTIRNCSFVNNTNKITATIFSTQYPTITNCIFRNNVAGAAVAIYIGDVGVVGNTKIQGCLFEGNTSDSTAVGACDIRGGNAKVSDCVFVNNRAVTYAGALYIVGSGNNISNCTFIGNSVSAGSAGAIYALKTTIRNCLIASNSASTYGGGIYLVYTSLVENCTIVSNYAGGAGGGLYITNSHAAVGTNNIIYHNMASSAQNYTNAAIGNAGLDYSCVYPEVAGTGNKTNDPGLVNLGGGNYRLSAHSLCVNAGMNQAWMTGAVDLDGRTRIRYGRVDMGAYETIYEGTIYGFH